MQASEVASGQKGRFSWRCAALVGDVTFPVFLGPPFEGRASLPLLGHGRGRALVCVIALLRWGFLGFEVVGREVRLAFCWRLGADWVLCG